MIIKNLKTTLETVSGDMRKYLDDNSNIFTNPKTCEYSDMFDKHCDEIIEHCQNALIRFRQAINQNHSDILLNFNIREYLDSEERIEIFQEINSEIASKEYFEHIE